MTVFRDQTIIVCDALRCDESTGGFLPEHADEALNQFLEEGWMFGSSDYCPNHRKDHDYE